METYNSENSNADEFLDLYRQLEETLTARYAQSKRKYSSPIVQFTSEESGKEWREELNMCRDIRNLLSHHADYEGASIVEPSDAVLTTLREILHEVEHPLTAETIMTPFCDMLVATENCTLDSILSQMDGSGYSHVPIIGDRGVMLGVFSVSTVYTYLRATDGDVSSRSVLRDFNEFLPIDRHSTESFSFVQRNTTYFDVRRKFGTRAPHSKRLAVIFVTDNGRQNESLRGMITPWDALRFK